MTKAAGLLPCGTGVAGHEHVGVRVWLAVLVEDAVFVVLLKGVEPAVLEVRSSALILDH